MNYRLLALFIITVLFSVNVFSQTSYRTGIKKAPIVGKAVISFRLDSIYSGDSVDIQYMKLKSVSHGERKKIKLKINNGIAEWVSEVDELCQIYTGSFIRTSNKYWLTEPGDIVKVEVVNGQLYFSGVGSEKFIILHRISKIKDSLQRKLLYPVDFDTKSLEEYVEYIKYLNDLKGLMLALIESYRDKLSPVSYNYFKNSSLDGIIDSRTDKFYSFISFAKRTGLSLKNICDVYDSTYAPYTSDLDMASLDNYYGSYGPFRLRVGRKYFFDANDVRYNSRLKKHLLYLNEAAGSFKGLAREKFLVEFLTDKMIADFGFIPEVDSALRKYYAEPGYPEYKIFVKEFETKYRKLIQGSATPEFSLLNQDGRLVNKSELKGKVVLMDFWFTGCKGCVGMSSALRKVKEEFRNDTNVVFLNISIDENKEKWLKSIQQKKYTVGSGLSLYTNGMGGDHPVIKAYSVTGYPTLYLLNGAGKIASNSVPDPRADDGKDLIKLIGEQLALLKDGPYVIYDEKKTNTYYIDGNSVQVNNVDSKNAFPLKVQTDQYATHFSVSIKERLINEPCVYEKPEKLIAFSDIEGNFDALRKLLQSNGIIDDHFNWTFGKGHLVFCGDMFDRGEQVTECLWLLYMLEEKAKANGGYVHFVLGNHEIMNLNQETKYLMVKYRENAEKLKRSYIELYNSNTEIGRWLRTKNIIEKVGDVLFVHGGVGNEVNQLSLSLDQMNALARPYYDKESMAVTSADKDLALMFNMSSPLWNRGYYLDKDVKTYAGQSGMDTVYKMTMKDVDYSLNKFQVNHIVTGHTIVGDTVSVHYNGKIINTDTRHAIDKSEALFIDGNRYYRVDASGNRVLLFIDDKVKK